MLTKSKNSSVCLGNDMNFLKAQFSKLCRKWLFFNAVNFLDSNNNIYKVLYS